MVTLVTATEPRPIIVSRAARDTRRAAEVARYQREHASRERRDKCAYQP